MSNYLIHYGVKGMKWGVRHDPERKGRKRKMSTRTKILIGAAVVAGVAALAVAGGSAYTRYGKLHADNIIKAGTVLKRVTHQPEGVKQGKRAYFADNKADANKYKAFFGRENDIFGNPVGDPKKFVEAKTTKDIKVAGLDTGEKEFNKLYNSNKSFAKIVDDNYGSWREFNHIGLLRDGKTGKSRPGADIFIDALRKKGYGGVADINDRKYSGYNTRAHILFDYKDKISTIKVSQLSDIDIKNAKKYTISRELVKNMASPKNLAISSAGATYIAGMSYYGDIENAKKKNKTGLQKK